MKITIITSVYNNKSTILDSITSVASQQHEYIEYIIIDGASSDGTLEIIEQNKSKITKLTSEPDKGIYDGLNKGVELATGDVIGFLHSDDIFAHEHVLDHIADCFNQFEIDGLYSDLVYTSKQDTAKVLRYWKGKKFSPSLLKKGWMPAHPTLFLRKEIYEKVGKFDLSYKIAADYDFMLRVLKSNPRLHYLPEVTYKMRLGGESNKSLKHIIQKSKEDLRAMRTNRVGGLATLFRKNLSKLIQFRPGIKS